MRDAGVDNQLSLVQRSATVGDNDYTEMGMPNYEHARIFSQFMSGW